MSMTAVNIALAGSSAASSSAAQQAAREAKKSACVSIESAFDPKTSSIQEKKQYSECIEVNYPDPVVMNYESKMAIKFSIVLVVACAVIGVIRAYRNSGDIEDAAFGAVGGFLFGLLALFFIASAAFVITY